MLGFRSCNSRCKNWLIFHLVAFLLPLMWCYDPCPEHLRQSSAARPCNIPKSEIEKAFKEAEKIVNNKARHEERLVRQGRVVNKKIKSAESTHQQAFGNPAVATKQKKQKTIQEASCILANKYRMSPEEVCCSLPKADLSSPSAASAVQNCVNPEPIQCDSTSRYRTFDGTCNNLNNPTWGSALSCFNRLLPAVYSANETFRRSVTGGPLPEPRLLSRIINAHQNWPTNYVNHLYTFLGQFLDHDITLTSASTTVDNEAIECCPIRADNHEQCAPIPIPANDAFYSQFSVTCLNFVRSAICDYCKPGPRVQINEVTAFIDMSLIYGNSQNESDGLRDSNLRGNLRMQQSSVGDLLPASNNPQNDQCSNPALNEICFLSGDIRVNQHPALTSLHTIFHREHNRIAGRMRIINPQWDENRIYNEVRKMVGAIMQVITYNEYLPITLGNERMGYFNLWMSSGTRATRYNPTIDPTLNTEFSTAAFRFGHSTINSLVDEFPRTQGHSGHLLRDVFFEPFSIYTGEIDPIMRGSTISPSQYFDRHVVPDVTNYLYRTRGNDTGFDLPAFNTQRGRDHGLAPYVDLVRYCSQEQIIITGFDDLYQLMPSENVDILRSMYSDVRDIDLFQGILSENWKSGAVIGPTAICIIGIQFQKLKFGDRYYFEHDGVFSPRQRNELRKVLLSRVLCDNTGISEVPEKAMLFRSHNNPIRSCSSLPEMNLNEWRET